jgi:hypothetical protein
MCKIALDLHILSEKCLGSPCICDMLPFSLNHITITKVKYNSSWNPGQVSPLKGTPDMKGTTAVCVGGIKYVDHPRVWRITRSCWLNNKL